MKTRIKVFLQPKLETSYVSKDWNFVCINTKRKMDYIRTYVSYINYPILRTVNISKYHLASKEGHLVYLVHMHLRLK